MKRTKLLSVILAALMLTGCSGNSDYEKLQEQIDDLMPFKADAFAEALV